VNKRFNSSTARGDSAVPETPYLSVSDVTRLVNDILELQFPQLLFRGEISQLTLAQSGHIYFTVKDEGAQLSCAMWAGVARTLAFKPRVGMTVRCHGRPNVYAQTGRFQVVVHRMFEDGEGELRRRFMELQKRLESEGFFAPERKRSVPFLPKAVGIVTSITGAVIHDMMVKIRERFPSMVVYLADTRVQGEGSASEIARAIRRLDRSGLVDVLIVARGGGSLEDLWAFNEEEVVKAVFACSKPVISGVGHEVDVTLCDLVADVRAPTPTAAAEMVVPHVEDLLFHISELNRRLGDTDRWYQPRVQRVDELSLRLKSRLVSVSKEAALKVKAAESHLSRIKPDRVLELLGLKLLAFEKRLSDAARRDKRDRQNKLETLNSRLEALSPQSVLNRGFSVLYSKGAHVRSVLDVKSGDSLEARVADGVITGVVRKENANG
jgi:exodeoxyribonuclease VII large subunit